MCEARTQPLFYAVPPEVWSNKATHQAGHELFVGLHQRPIDDVVDLLVRHVKVDLDKKATEDYKELS